MLRFSINSLKDLFEESTMRYAGNTAYSYTNGETYTYNDIRAKVEVIQAQMSDLGLTSGDKIAILSQNMPNWNIAYFAITTAGMIAVPILPDFSPAEISNILEHSQSRAIFVSDRLRSKIEEEAVSKLSTIYSIDNLSLVKGEKVTSSATVKATPMPDDLAVIIYTSGTTGRSKGVMLSHKNLASEVMMASDLQPVYPEDVFLSILPLSHTYESSLGMLLPFYGGSSVVYMEKPPAASTLVPLLKKVQPTIMLSVPLIIEKIYKGQILPKFTQSKVVKMLYSIAPIRKMLNRVAGKKLMETFGGRIRFFGIGGAKLDPIVEKFLMEAKFPIAIGYGLTETAPLLAGTNPQMATFQSTGPAINGVSIRIDNPNPQTGEGEIVCSGPNIMMGYYKDEEQTKAAFTEDGWFKTGDLGIVDKKGFIYIKGRLKNMILGPSGENIYPEEIESVINEYSFVVESLVVEKKGKLVAMVHFNYEELEKQFHHMKEDAIRSFNEKVEKMKAELQDYVNARVNKFSKISLVIEQKVQFEKTPTHKIKRYLYW
ncbi:AMP-binding protein [Alistipes sp. ZOR0009]|uniref:AMP-binding protein n=1 Tax=Alistipes sp. ZOR0009 TaxID=1339253 RepID=UPI000648698A|nr:AMP-binding protein [Alistipes sp. ZOR0009]